MEGKGGTLSLRPVTGTAYRLDQGLAARSVPSARTGSIPGSGRSDQFPVPAWLPCPGCSYILSYILMEVDFDREFEFVG